MSTGASVASPRKARVFVVDDHPIVRQGLAQLINQEADLAVCGEAEDEFAALELIGGLNPDVVIVDVSLKTTSGLDLIKSIQMRQSGTPILVLSMHDEALYAERALRAGARGFIMKQEANEKVLVALRRVLRGEIFVSERMESRILERVIGRSPGRGGSSLELLSDRELEIFQLIGRGHGTRQIADELHLSVKTVESHRAHIKEKLKLRNASELIRHAVQWVDSERA